MTEEKSVSLRVGAMILVPEPNTEDGHDNEEMSPFVPMLPLDGTTVIKREIHTLRRAGINTVMVLCGDVCRKQLKTHLSHHGVKFLESTEETSQSFGMQAVTQAAQYCDRIVLIPVNCPAFLPETISRLLREPDPAVAVCNGVRSDFFVFRCNSGDIDTAAAFVQAVFFEEQTDDAEDLRSAKGLPVNDQRNSRMLLAEVETGDRGILLSVTEQGLEETERHVRTLRNSNPLRMKTKLVIGKENDFFGPGLYHLLCQVQKTGSIQAAAADLGMSYSKCWKLLNRAEREMGFPFLERYNGGKNGGSSRVTQEGKLFLERYHAMDEDLKRISRHFFDVYFKDFQ